MAYSKNRRLAEIVSDTSGNLSVEGIIVPTQSNSDNDTSAASTAFVHAHVNALVDSAPGTLNTLNELAAALNDDANFNTTISAAVNAKLPLAGGTLTGDVATSGSIIFDNNVQAIKIKDAAGTAGYVFYLDNADTLVVGNGTIVEKIRLDTSGNEGAITIDTNGNVGVGTASPDHTLHVLSGSASMAEFASSNASPFINFARSGARTAYIQLHEPGASGTSQLRFGTGSSHNPTTSMTIDENNQVGIGTTAPSTYFSGGNNLVVKQASGEGGITVVTADNTTGYLLFADGTSGDAAYRGQVAYKHGTNEALLLISSASMSLHAGSSRTERMRIDSSGNVMISKNAANTTAVGNVFFNYGRHGITVNATTCQVINRLSNDGTFTVFQKDNANVGQIDVAGGNNLTISGSQANHAGLSFATNAILPAVVGATNSGIVDLGASSEKFKDLYLSNALNIGGAITSTVASGGGVYHAITHSGNESWSWAAQSGAGSDDYLDVGINGGTRAMSWHEDGKVGIGTTIPSKALHVSAGTAGGIMCEAVQDNTISLKTTSGGTKQWNIGNYYTSWQGLAAPFILQPVASSGSMDIALCAATNTPTKGIVIKASGNVGIGTNSPAVRLQIGNFTSSTEQLNFAVSQNGTSKIFFTDNNTTEGGFIKNTGTTYGSDFVFGGTWNTDLDSVAIRVRQNSSSGAASQWKAKMGIGTTAPIAGLEVRGFNEDHDQTDADDATGAEEPILMLRGANGASVSEWVHSTKATAPSGGTQTAMISWYRFDMPGGWSGTGTPGFLEIHNQMSGMHASGSACEKFYLSLPNEHGNISTAGGLQNTSISRYYSYTANVGAYTTSLSTVFYYGNSSSFGYAAGAIFMKVTHASREPFFTMYAKYIGGTGASRNYPQKLHFLGTEVTNNHAPANVSTLSIHDGRGML